ARTLCEGPAGAGELSGGRPQRGTHRRSAAIRFTKFSFPGENVALSRCIRFSVVAQLPWLPVSLPSLHGDSLQNACFEANSILLRAGHFEVAKARKRARIMERALENAFRSPNKPCPQ